MLHSSLRAAPIQKKLLVVNAVCISTQFATCSPLTARQSATSAIQGKTDMWLVFSLSHSIVIGSFHDVTDGDIFYLTHCKLTSLTVGSQIRLLGIFSKSGWRRGQPSALVSKKKQHSGLLQTPAGAVRTALNCCEAVVTNLRRILWWDTKKLN